MKQIITLILVISMTMGIWAYPIVAKEVHDTKETLNYVSLGDSMTNGIGLPGYDETVHEGSTNNGSNGYLEAAPDAYPAQFTEWLKSFTGKDVNLTQLATSAARAEDIWYILNHGTENAFEADPWTQYELLWNNDRWGHPNGNWLKADEKHVEYNAQVAETYRDAIKNADVISYAMGSANFGVFLMGRIFNLVGLGSAEGLETDREHFSYMTVENAIDLIACDEVLNTITMANSNMDVASFVASIYEYWLEYARTNNLSVDVLDEIGDYFAYTTASFFVSYCKTIDLIIEMNSDVELIIMPLVNTIQGLEVEIDGVHIDFGAILGDFYSSINEYMVEYIKLKQSKGETNDATFMYADFKKANDNSEFVESFAQAFDTLYASVPENTTVETYPETRLFCHSRFIGDIQQFVFPILFGGSSFDYDDKFNEYDVRDYEIAKANGTATFVAYAGANVNKVEYISYYLAVVDAVLNSINSVPNINVNDLKVPEGEVFNIFSLLGPVVGDLGTTVYNKVVVNAEAVAPRLAYELIAANITPVLEPYFSNPEFLYVFGADLEIYGDDSVEKTLAMIELAMINDGRFDLNDDLKAMKVALVDGYTTIANNLEPLAMLTVIPETLSAELTSVGLLEALLALYGRLKLAWGLSAHPSAKGHDMMTEAIIYAYENKEIICCHAYDDCMDAICNLCDAERSVVGHNFTNYIYNNDATCIQNGTETAKCDACEETHTREAVGTVTDHNFEDGRCSLCNEPDTNSSTNDNSNTNNNNHKQGFFYRLINWIINFFTKLFGFGKK